MIRTMIVLAAVLTVAACGKKGDPTPIGPADQVTYPKIYPTK